MLVTQETNSGPPSRTPSILDSPTLARVERARLRQEATNGQQRENSLERSLLDKQSLLIGRIPVGQMTGPIKRGLLWQQRDRLFSRWKERYFVLTRDYLNCFKRASGSPSEKISEMGQFIFKIKLVDVEKVEWMNRRSYSAIGLLLGREGRVLLRCETGLEDWFELLEECTLSSKERRALRLTQGPRSRASLAAPVSHSSLQNNHLGLGGTYSSAIEDWLLTRHHKSLANHHHLHSDSVPDLNIISENGLSNGMLTNQSTPKKIPNARHNFSMSSNGYGSHNGSFYNNFPYSPLKKLSDNYLNGNEYIINDEDDDVVELRRGGRYRENEELYRRPLGPTSGNNDNIRYSNLTDLDASTCDSGLDTPPSTHRPSSYRDNMYCISPYHSSNNNNSRNQSLNKNMTTDTGISSSRGTLVSPGNSFRLKKQQIYHQNINNNNNNNNNNHINSYGSRYSVQDTKIVKCRIEDTKNSMRSIKTDFYDQNRYNNNHTNSNGNLNILNGNNANVIRDRYQHPALAAIISEAQGMKFRDRSYSDCQQIPRRQWISNTPSPKRIPFLGTPPTRV